LSFDLLNGALGFLNSCHTASAMIVSGQARTCLIVCGNVMVLRLNKDSSQPGFCSTGAAMLLDQAQHDDTGFNSFFFKSFPEHRTAYDSHLIFQEGKFSLVFREDSNINQLYLSSISKTLSEFLEREQVSIDAFDLILPPQISPTFISNLAALLDVDPARFVDVTKREGDLFTASLPAAMDHVMGAKLAKPGQRALIINVGSGIQVGCASYTF
jgi:3-oxoacyl-[acyl-carrier-protein] synthase III